MTEPNLPEVEWFSILHEGFGAETIPLLGTTNITIFKKALFRVGYINFPFGIRYRDEYGEIMRPETQEVIRYTGIDLLRLNWPQQFDTKITKAATLLPEVSIYQLGTWSEHQLDSDVRYKIRRARREGLSMRQASLDDAPFIYTTYLETIRRHGGKRRYTQAYFRALCQTGKQNPMLSILIAETPKGEACGFHISTYRQGTAYYLHGGMLEQHARYRPGYVLMCEAIRSARDAGCHTFNFMPSPTNQPALLKFKRKWGGDVYEIKNFSVPISPKGHVANFALDVLKR